MPPSDSLAIELRASIGFGDLWIGKCWLLQPFVDSFFLQPVLSSVDIGASMLPSRPGFPQDSKCREAGVTGRKSKFAPRSESRPFRWWVFDELDYQNASGVGAVEIARDLGDRFRESALIAWNAQNRVGTVKRGGCSAGAAAHRGRPSLIKRGHHAR